MHLDPAPQGGVRSGTGSHTRELADRESDGVHVVLLWHPAENALTVSVEDLRHGDSFRAINVKPGAENRRFVQITEGLRPGQSVARQRPILDEETGS